jgi:hypothetical protein
MHMSGITRRDVLAAAAAGATLATAGVAAAVEEKEVAKGGHDVKRLEAGVKKLGQSLAKLSDEKEFSELIRLFRKPGWTTPAEFTLVAGILDAMNGQAESLVNLKQALVQGSREVSAG